MGALARKSVAEITALACRGKAKIKRRGPTAASAEEIEAMAWLLDLYFTDVEPGPLPAPSAMPPSAITMGSEA